MLQSQKTQYACFVPAGESGEDARGKKLRMKGNRARSFPGQLPA